MNILIISGILCWIIFSTKFPVSLLARGLDSYLIYTIFSIVFIYIFWLVRCELNAKAERFTWKTFLIPCFFIIIMSILYQTGYVSEIWFFLGGFFTSLFNSVKEFIEFYLPWNLGKRISKLLVVPQ